MTPYRWKILSYVFATFIATILALHYFAETEWSDAFFISLFICAFGFLGGILTGDNRK